MAFKDIIGQETAKKLLSSQIKADRIAGAYLFYGPEGVGKTLTATTFAKAINCVAPLHEKNSGDSCDVCQPCKEIENRRSPDFLLITPNQNILIDQIREIRTMLSYKSIWLRSRVIIIKEADKFTEEAANAFLKILEEPPTRTIFILTTSKIASLLPTISSRCQKIRFSRIKPQEIEDFLHKHKSLGKTIPAHELALRANGSITRAMKLLSPETQVIENMAREFTLSTPLQRMQMIEKLAQLDQKELLRVMQELYINLLNPLSKFKLDKSLPTEKILTALTILERAFKAFSQNVHKQLILYYLSKELP